MLKGGTDGFRSLDNRRIVCELKYLAEIYRRMTEPFSGFLRLIEVWRGMDFFHPSAESEQDCERRKGETTTLLTTKIE